MRKRRGISSWGKKIGKRNGEIRRINGELMGLMGKSSGTFFYRGDASGSSQGGENRVREGWIVREVLPSKWKEKARRSPGKEILVLKKATEDKG